MLGIDPGNWRFVNGISIQVKCKIRSIRNDEENRKKKHSDNYKVVFEERIHWFKKIVNPAISIGECVKRNVNYGEEAERYDAHHGC
jgi:hypothetical protein